MALAENWTQSRGNTGTMGKYNVRNVRRNEWSQRVCRLKQCPFSSLNTIMQRGHLD